MRRYRKGQLWHPPTAAESSADADAAGAHQRHSTQPQDLAPVGQSILVKTPEDGIPARDENTVYYAKCKRYIQRNAPDGQEIVETDEEVIVYNLSNFRQPGDHPVGTALTECSIRYVLPQEGPFFAWATTTAAWDDETATFQVDNVELFSGATWDGDDPLTVGNPLEFDTEDDQTCLLGYNAGEEEWQVLVVKEDPANEAEEITVVTDIEYDDTAHAFRFKKRTVKVYSPGTESGFADNVIKALTARSLVTDVEDATTKLTHDKRDIYIVEEGSETTDDVIVMAEQSVVTDVEDATTYLTHDKKTVTVLKPGSETTDNIVALDDC